MFILDCTGSMGSWIKAAKNEILSIIDFTMNQYFGIEIRVSIIAYRDIQDAERFEIFDFSTDYQSAFQFIEQLVAKGGGDAPEDIAGAFDKALT